MARIEIPTEMRVKNREERPPEALVWLEKLPGIAAEIEARWRLDIGPPFANLSYNYVAQARRVDGSPAVLKLCFPDEEFACETEATRALGTGGSAVRMLDYDLDRGAQLLELIHPGQALTTLRDDVEATSIAAGLTRKLWQPAPPMPHSFPTASSWLQDALRPGAIPGIKAELPWLQPVLKAASEMDDPSQPRLLLHGDLHQDNILFSAERGWLAIDAKGVVGEAAWEIAPFLFNNLPADHDEWPSAVRRRADQFAEELSIERRRLYAWSAVRAAQAAFWSLRDGADLKAAAVICAEALSGRDQVR